MLFICVDEELINSDLALKAKFQSSTDVESNNNDCNEFNFHGKAYIYKLLLAVKYNRYTITCILFKKSNLQ